MTAILGGTVEFEASLRAEVTDRRDQHAGLALDRLEQHRDGRLVDRRLECRRVAVGDAHETGRVRTEVGTGIRVAREADDRGRAPVEIAVRNDDGRLVLRNTLDAVAPGTGDLDAGFARGGHLGQCGQARIAAVRRPSAPRDRC